jgi:hypothetical protein
MLNEIINAAELIYARYDRVQGGWKIAITSYYQDGTQGTSYFFIRDLERLMAAASQHGVELTYANL